jgi:phosphinothricin acetyltransferase
MVHLLIRNATEDDVPAITAIYNESIASTTGAWTEEPDTLEYREDWFRRQRERGFAVVVADEAGRVVGFAAYGEFRDTQKWPGYRFTVENSIHVTESHWGRGIGRALLRALLDRASAAGLRAIVAAIDGSNAASIAFHSRLGYRQVGLLPGIGEKFGRRLDLVLMQVDVEAQGGDPACWLDRVCDDCGAVIEGTAHVCRPPAG